MYGIIFKNVDVCIAGVLVIFGWNSRMFEKIGKYNKIVYIQYLRKYV